ncbi:hypothetical protein ACWGNZ_14800 [Sphingomonas zeae]
MIRAERKRLAAEIFVSRRDRDDVFVTVDGGFGEPAWDMLLILYILDAEGKAATREELLVAVHVERAIAEPYIYWLISKGLAASGDEEGTVVLRDAGRDMMDRYLDRRSSRGNDKKFMH